MNESVPERYESSLDALLRRVTENVRDLRRQFNPTGIREAGLGDLLIYLEHVFTTSLAEPELKQLLFFADRIRRDVEVGVVSVYTGMISVCADAMRDLMEIEFLLRDFKHNPTSIGHWYEASDADRHREFAPNTLRQREANRLGINVIDLTDSRDYKAHSQALHVSPNRSLFRRGVATKPDVMFETDPALSEIFAHSRAAIAAYYELANLLAPNTLLRSPEGATKFQDAAKNAREFTLPVLFAVMQVMAEEEDRGEEDKSRGEDL